MSRGIRRYGPGKFNTIIDSYVYDLTMEGMGEGTIGDVSEVGFAAEGIPLGPEALPEIERVAKEDGDELTPEECDLIKESHGAIVTENDQGFVAVDFYDDQEEYEKDLDELEAQVSGEDEEGEEEEEDEEEEEEEEGDEEEEPVKEEGGK